MRAASTFCARDAQPATRRSEDRTTTEVLSTQRERSGRGCERLCQKEEWPRVTKESLRVPRFLDSAGMLDAHIGSQSS